MNGTEMSRDLVDTVKFYKIYCKVFDKEELIDVEMDRPWESDERLCLGEYLPNLIDIIDNKDGTVSLLCFGEIDTEN